MPNRRQFLGSTAVVATVAASGAAADKPVRTSTGSFWESLDRQMTDWLGVKPTDRVLDAGCGRGDHLGPFAEAAGAVSGMDLDPKTLATAKERVKAHPQAGRLTFHEGDVLRPPFEKATFDLVWTSHVMHILNDPVAGVKALAATVKPGGRVAVREDFLRCSVQLPLDVGVGQPGLEDRLHAVFAEWFVNDRLKRGRVPYGWQTVLAEAGLKAVTVKSFLFEAAPPWGDAQEAYLRGRLRRELEWGDKLSAEDRRTIERITDPKAKEYVFRRPDLHIVSVGTVYVGSV